MWHVRISLVVKADIWLGFHPVESRFPDPAQGLWVRCVEYDHTEIWPQVEFSSLLNFSNKSAGGIFKRTYFVEWSFVWYLVAGGMLHTFTKSMQQIGGHLTWCWIAKVVDSFQVFTWCSLIEIDCDIYCVSPELNRSLEINYQHLHHVSYCINHSVGSTILLFSIWRALVVCHIAGHKNNSEHLIIIFSPSIVTPPQLQLVPYWIYWGMK